MSIRQPLSVCSALHRSFVAAGSSSQILAGPSRLGLTQPSLHASRYLSTCIPRFASIPQSTSPLPSFFTTKRPSQTIPPTAPRSTESPRALNGSSVFAQIFRRAFSSSRAGLVRQTYFPKKSNYGGQQGRQGSSNGWFRQMRRRIDGIPPMRIVYALIALNVVVFGLWQYALTSWQRFRDPSLYNFLTKNFVLNEANIMAGRVYTLLTACFSHSTGTHIIVNCLSLYFVAPAVASLIGSSAFLGLYLGGGIIASSISLAWHRFRKDRWAGSEGASGAIYACLGFYGAIFPSSQFLLFFVIPMPAWVLIGGMFAYDTYSAVFQPGSGTDSAGHIGGILAGLGAALWVRKRGVGGPRFGRYL